MGHIIAFILNVTFKMSIWDFILSHLSQRKVCEQWLQEESVEWLIPLENHSNMQHALVSLRSKRLYDRVRGALNEGRTRVSISGRGHSVRGRRMEHWLWEFILISLLRSILVPYNNVPSNDGLYNWNKFIFKWWVDI